VLGLGSSTASTALETGVETVLTNEDEYDVTESFNTIVEKDTINTP
jgi:hypothetical protein